MKACSALALLALTATLAACATAPTTNDQPPGGFGWLDGDCVAMADPGLAPGTTIRLVDLGENPRHSEAVIAGPADAASCPALRPERRAANLAGGLTFYRLQSAPETRAAIAVSGKAPLAGLAFDTCTTSEGVRYTVRSGEKLVWSGYEYLGYDLEPSCGE